MERGLQIKWIIFNVTVLWLLMKTGPVLSNLGIVTASPGVLLPLTSSVNITCSLSWIAGSLKIKKKNSTHSFFIRQLYNTNTISVHDSDLSPRQATYICLADKKIVNGIYVEAGIPPDQPTILNCEQEGALGRIYCLWKEGRETFIQTNYTLQLWQRRGELNVTIDSVRRGGEYIAVVAASNGLGSNSSQPYTFTFFDAVIPHPPNKTIVCDRVSSKCIVTLQDSQNSSNFQIRYRPADSTKWQWVEIKRKNTYTLKDLQPFTRYEFQVSCKFLIDKGKWSNWSQPIIIQTPEGVPSGMLDVWYHWREIDSNTRNIILFWKPMSRIEARGLIQHYEVLFYRGSDRSPVHNSTTRDTWLSRDIERTRYVIVVSAHNSKGNSPPTHINVTTEDISGVPSPVNVVAKSSGNENMIVSWEIPQDNETLDVDYIVEWKEQKEKKTSYTYWVKVSKMSPSVTISENLSPYVCYEFRVYSLREGRAGIPTMTTASIKQEAPYVDPEFHYEVQKHNSILITWKEIPPDKRRGCIVEYTIYMQSMSFSKQFKIPANQSMKHQYEIPNIQLNVRYVLRMSASTTAGESPRMLGKEIYPDGAGFNQEFLNSFIITLLCVFIILCLCSIPSLRERFKCFLYGCNKKVPDPANCHWASELTNSTHKVEPFPSPLPSTSTYDETETLEVEEIDSDNETPFTPATYTCYETNKVLLVEEINEPAKEAKVPILPNLSEGCCYKSLKPKQVVSTEPVSDYLVNQEITVDYLPTDMLSGNTENEEESIKDETLSLEFLMPKLHVGEGMLRLDAVKICSLDITE
ncbi:interleukin-12 receptor subunit beta-2-like isoform X1 [Xenopus laevis]|uniref:Interleukin-12 receptor subunit beta-2-like isoform X1 n=1 Tax=Xenopus laevis TaxID=8355 RepID=A0A8J0V5X5_XENLA|nr:interleukin-12 receptor subunit beta-2-like isoform X1 [Xenopus laevis]